VVRARVTIRVRNVLLEREKGLGGIALGRVYLVFGDRCRSDLWRLTDI